MRNRFALAICLGLLGAATVGAAPASAGKAQFTASCLPDAPGEFQVNIINVPGGTAKIGMTWQNSILETVAFGVWGKPIYGLYGTFSPGVTYASGYTSADIRRVVVAAIASNGSVKATALDTDCLS